MLEFKTDTFRLMNIDEDLPRCPMGLGFTATDPEMLRGTEEEPARLPVEEAQGPRLKVFHPGCVSHSQKPKKWKKQLGRPSALLSGPCVHRNDVRYIDPKGIHFFSVKVGRQYAVRSARAVALVSITQAKLPGSAAFLPKSYVFA